MPATRSTTASPASRTRSRTIQPSDFCTHTPATPTPSSRSKPSRSSSWMSRREKLEERHWDLYPVTKSLGILGTKDAKKTQIEKLVKDQLHFFSTTPPRGQWLNPSHEGHDLLRPVMTTGRNGRAYGSWVQPCVGTNCVVPNCTPSVRHVYRIAPPVPNHILQLEPLATLLKARQELLPKPRPVGSAPLPLPHFPNPSAHSPGPEPEIYFPSPDSRPRG
ncbi:hypothetical protein C8J57DRAFT_1250914 [Mycena rebaudengoi]|nr:hypothetical protein C8J57DRAFT_1250914 [Mycena rebaudengoi]